MGSFYLYQLILKDVKLEFKQKNIVASTLIYVVSSVFITALSFKNSIQPIVWNALFWIIYLFIAINISSKNFMLESKGKMLFNYLYYKPFYYMLSKALYNSVFLFLLSLLSYLCFVWFIGNLTQNILLFVLVLFISSIGFSFVLIITSAIAAKANNSFSLMPILSFPLLLPLLLLSIKISKNALDGLNWSVSIGALSALILLCIVVFILAGILFNYIWKE